ncbi:MAG: hypothetical protein ACXVEF_25545 [Polyangiales bacterium]
MNLRLLSSVIAVVCVACSSSSSDSTTSDASNVDTAAPTAPKASCVQPGDKGNDVGVGTPCTPLGHECGAFAGAPVCLADVGQDQWMCTRIGCTKDSECGTGATCFKDPGGSACVPNRCLDSMDAGPETGETDSGSDTGSSTSDAAEAG